VENGVFGKNGIDTTGLFEEIEKDLGSGIQKARLSGPRILIISL